MLGFILKFSKGLVIGWVASLMMLFVKRMLAKAFDMDTQNSQTTAKQPKYNPYKTNSANQNNVAVVDTIWVGMTTAQLVKSFGPALTKQYSGTREIWTYLNLKGKGTQTAIAVEHGVIVNWREIQSTTPARFAAPRP